MSQEEKIKQLEQALETMALNQKGLIEESNSNAKIIAGQKKELEIMSGEKVSLIYAKMLAVKKDLGAVGKDQKNVTQNWMFRGIDQLLNAIHPILNKHGVGVLPTIAQLYDQQYVTNEKTGKMSKNTKLAMKYTFFAEDGSSLDVVIPGEGVDPGDKGTNKALSAALKYCLIQTFCIPTEDMAEADLDCPTVDNGGESKTPAKTTKKVTKKTSFRKPKIVTQESAVGEL